MIHHVFNPSDSRTITNSVPIANPTKTMNVMVKHCLYLHCSLGS